LPLHQNRRGKTRKGVLNGGEHGTVGNGGVDEGNQRKNGEELPGSVPQLQRKKGHIGRCLDQATGDERRGGELSLADGGRRQRDPRWRPEEWSLSCKNLGKRSVRSQRNSMHEESTNGGRSRWRARWWLTSRWGKNGEEEETLVVDFFYKGGRRVVSAQRSHASAMSRRRQSSLAGTRCGEVVPCLSRLRALHGRFKPTQTTVQLGRAQSFTQKLFHLFKLALTCKL
jgi:hypothetical protein